METLLPHWLWPIAGVTGLGVLTDFLLGRAGQKRVKGWLETWWIKFDDVHRNNFGREEALYAVHLIDHYFGRKFFCLHRSGTTTIILWVSSVSGYLFFVLYRHKAINIINLEYLFIYGADFLVFYFAMSISISISFTRLASSMTAMRCGNTPFSNLIAFSALLVITYLLLIYWIPIIDFLLMLVKTTC
jgi:hypothetical protein